MMNISKIYDEIVKKTSNGTDVPIVDKNGVSVHKLTIFEDIVLRNLDNLDSVLIILSFPPRYSTNLFKSILASFLLAFRTASKIINTTTIIIIYCISNKFIFITC